MAVSLTFSKTRPDELVLLQSQLISFDCFPVNQARAMRVGEIVADFRSLQNYIAAVRVNPSAEESNEEGYVLLRAYVNEAQALLSQPFRTQNGTGRDEEQNKEHLRRYLSRSP